MPRATCLLTSQRLTILAIGVASFLGASLSGGGIPVAIAQTVVIYEQAGPTQSTIHSGSSLSRQRQTRTIIVNPSSSRSGHIYRDRDIEDTTLVRPVIIDSDIEDSTLVNPVIIDSRDRGGNTVIVTPTTGTYGRSQTVRPANRGCRILAEMRTACQ